ncbi:MAG: PH domain-containing protein [Hyphomonadaceae bacterium]|nr:PH domain-containing protein [Hyphomonadaceae bacterium]
MAISSFVEPIVFAASLLAGPIVVGRVFRKRTSVAGTVHAGQSGMSPIFWGIPAGLVTAITVLLIIDPPAVYETNSELVQSTLLLFALLLLLSSPLLIWGAHLWTWDSDGLEFRSLFRRKRIAWSDIIKVTPAGEGGFAVSTPSGVAFRTSRYVAGNQLIWAAVQHYRPSAIG